MRRHQGFTLAEALVVVAIVGILAAVAFPSMSKLLATQGVRSASYDLFADLIYARSEAIARGVTVTITGVAGVDYKKGWTITAGPTDIQLRTQSERSAGITFTASQNSFSFDRTGRASDAMTFSIVPTEATTDNREDYMKRCIRLDPSGRPKSAEGACA